MDSLSAATLLAMPLGVPPIEEQQACAMHAAKQSTLLDAMKDPSNAAITLLQERRSALISAAVTGQIDVRGLAGSEAA